MTSWQRRARLGVLVFGIAIAVVVYFAMGDRVKPLAPKAPDRIDPTAVVESKAGFIERVQGAEREFEVSFDSSLTYSDNTIRNFGVRIKPKANEGRQFVVTAKEGHTGQDQRVLDLAGDVNVTASDGFQMATEAASFNQDDGIARTPGAVKFGRGRMSGSGRNVSYDTNQDVLVITDEPHVVTTADDEGGTMLEFTAGTATLDRIQHLMTLDRTVHIVRGEQTFESDRAVAFLTDENDVVTRIELRGSSRVSGESASVASMSARDIDLDYTDDGATLETAALEGDAALTMTGQNGAAGRQMSGERLELALDADGYLTKAIGHGSSGANRVVLALPAADDVPARTIRARHLDADGAPGKGLTAARFTEEVEFREQATAAEKSDRVVTARVLQTRMDNDKVTGAFFTGETRFEDRGLVATAPTVNYLPDQGTLQLRDTDPKGGPRIQDEHMSTEANEIDVTLNPRRVQARALPGLTVRTTLQPASAKPGAKPDAGSKLPGVFNQEKAATVRAQALDYSGESGRTVYFGGATNKAILIQHGTSNAISAERLELDQNTGDLVAAGNATSRLALATSESIGAAKEIRFENEQRLIRLTAGSAPAPAPAPGGRRTPAATPAAPARATARGSAPPPATPGAAPAPNVPSLAGPPLARLSGGFEGNLEGESIVATLAATENRIEQVDVTTKVSVVFDKERSAIGDRLVYRTSDEYYELTGTPAAPVRLVTRRPPECRESSGQLLTYQKSTDSMILDGKGVTRASMATKPCTPAPPR